MAYNPQAYIPPPLRRPPRRGWNSQDQIVRRRANILGCIGLGAHGSRALSLPVPYFSQSLQLNFDEEELERIYGRGLPVRFYDESGYYYDIPLKHVGGLYVFGGPHWQRLVRNNDLRRSDVVALWFHRERMVLGQSLAVPSIILLLENPGTVRISYRITDRQYRCCETCGRLVVPSFAVDD